MKALTLEELRQMPGQPVWCPEIESYGIIKCDGKGQWKDKPFFHGSWYNQEYKISTDFEYDIEKRGLKCYKVTRDKETPMQPKEKVGGFGDKITVCPNCEQAAISNPYRKGKEIYPYCPWCGQKLKEGEYDRHN